MAGKGKKLDRPAYWDRMRMIRESELSANQKLLLVWLAHYAGESGEAFPSQKQLAADMSMKERQTRRIIASLGDIVQASKRGFGGVCSYEIDWSKLDENTGTKSASQSGHPRPDSDDSIRSPTTALEPSNPVTGDRSIRSSMTAQSGHPRPDTSLYEHKKEHKYNVKGGDAPELSPTKPVEAVLLGDTADGVADAWNQVEGICHVRLPLTAKRRKALASRLKDDDWRKGWREAIERVSQSAFCCGGNDRNWKATFEWFLRPDTVVKLLEGQYDGGKRNVGDHAGLKAFLAAHEGEEDVDVFEQSATEGWNSSG